MKFSKFYFPIITLICPLVCSCSNLNNVSEYVFSYSFDDGRDSELRSIVLSDEDQAIVNKYNELEKYPEHLKFLSEYEVTFVSDSANSKEEAIKVGKERVTDTRYKDSQCVCTESKIIYHTELFYLLNVYWDYQNDKGEKSSYSSGLVSFKSEFVDYTEELLWKGTTFKMKIKDLSKAKDILDIILSSGYVQIGGHKYISSEIIDNSDSFTYKNYIFAVSYGDCWGDVPDSLQILKKTYSIDKKDGNVTYLGQEILKEIECRL